MAFPWRPTAFGPRGRELKWLNSVFESHACFCGCDSAYLHFITGCNHSEYGFLTDKEILAAECLSAGGSKDAGPSTSTDKNTGDAVDGLIPGELEGLFQEPFTEEQGEDEG